MVINRHVFGGGKNWQLDFDNNSNNNNNFNFALPRPILFEQVNDKDSF